jgi:hypothetical protein
MTLICNCYLVQQDYTANLVCSLPVDVYEIDSVTEARGFNYSIKLFFISMLHS